MWLRFIVALLVLASLAVASIPLLVLRDLASGGDGYGLCPRGLEGCRTVYTAAPELATLLILLLFALLALLRVTMQVIRRVEQRRRFEETARRLRGATH
jgi:hypothetical protein